MKSGQGFRLHPGAAQDITEIWEFIAQDSVDAATRVRESFLKSFHNLAAFPGIGHFRPDLSARSIRFQTVFNYLIAYAPDEKPLSILGIIHGRRSPQVIKAILDERF